MTATHTDIRPSPLAGLWYPAAANRLQKTIDTYLSRAVLTIPPGPILGILAPHAGLRYSGPVAAYSFMAIADQRPDVVAVLCPYHRPPYHLHNEALVTTAHAAYRTPLGIVPVAHDLLDALRRQMRIATIRQDQEHAIEIELPFLQHILSGGFNLLPIMLLDQSVATMQKLGNALATVLKDQNALLVASSDLSHFFPQEVANRLDQATLDGVRSYDPARVIETGGEPGEGACGRGAIAAVMWAAQQWGANNARILRYATSGDAAGDYQSVVGYASGIFYRAAPH